MSKTHTVEQAVITASGYATKGSGATAVASGLTQRISENPDVLSLADVGVVVGMIGVIVGVLVNAVAQYFRHRREEEIHKARMDAIRNDCEYEG